jgi:hypothetical protein
MEFAHGLNLDINSVNEILKIAQEKGYLSNKDIVITCDSFIFDEKDKTFKFYLLEKNCIEVDMNKFIECYTLFLEN